MSPHYPFPPQVVLPLLYDLLRQKRRDFQRDARFCILRLRPPLKVEGEEYVPQQGPCLLTINHYSSPEFRAWWLAIAISACLPMPVHWLITAEWTSTNRLYARTVTPFSYWLFHRFARIYGFTNMPPMPPRPGEEAERARSVRQVLGYARNNPTAIIGLAPEGGDRAGGILTAPPPGVGRFIFHITKMGFPILPAGIFEKEGALCLRYGPVYKLPEIRGENSKYLDHQAVDIVMKNIASLLPEYLHGDYREFLKDGQVSSTPKMPIHFSG